MSDATLLYERPDGPVLAIGIDVWDHESALAVRGLGTASVWRGSRSLLSEETGEAPRVYRDLASALAAAEGLIYRLDASGWSLRRAEGEVMAWAPLGPELLPEERPSGLREGVSTVDALLAFVRWARQPEGRRFVESPASPVEVLRHFRHSTAARGLTAS